jgi:hypothetical protein
VDEPSKLRLISRSLEELTLSTTDTSSMIKYTELVAVNPNMSVGTVFVAM